ncbi:MAG TPA: DUF4124 domain-containing protein [Chromatiales bacterium]|nr:DUF4124 domain-containing protein [Chromatiales bacterium]
MKLFAKFLMLFVVVAVAAPFFLKDDAGRPLMTLDKLSMPEVTAPPLPEVHSTLKDVARMMPGLGDGEEAATVRAYKWQDAEGVWHFSDHPVSSAEEIAIDPNASVTDFDAIPLTVTGGGNTSHASSPAGGAFQVMEQARDVNQLAQERFERQSRVIEAQSR